MGTYDLYKIEAESLLEARLLVESILGVEFHERESLYHRGPYFAIGDVVSGESITLRFTWTRGRRWAAQSFRWTCVSFCA